MRKVILSLCLCLVYMSAVSAERPRPFEVKRLHSWAPEYLTITNVYEIIWNLEIYNLLNCPVKEEYLWMDVIEGRLWHSHVILSIDGQTTKNMSEKTFYDIVGQKDEHDMIVCKKDEGGYNNPIPVKFRIKEPPIWMQKCFPYTQDEFLNGDNIPGLHVTSNSELAERAGQILRDDLQCKQERQMYWDRDFDWFSIQTYDFVPTSDPAIDKKLLEKFAAQFKNLTRDTNNPDVLIRIARDEEQSVNSTYVPPTVQVVSDGATTQRVYNYITKDYSYQTQQRNRVVREGGYVETTRVENLYLEIVMLDTKRIEEPTPPIIYQLKYQRHVVNRGFDLLQEYLNVISWVQEPHGRVETKEYELKSYDLEELSGYKPRGAKPPFKKYACSYFKVRPTGLPNPHILGETELNNGDVLEYAHYRYADGKLPSTYKIVERNNNKFKTKEQVVCRRINPYKDFKVTFTLWNFVIDSAWD